MPRRKEPVEQNNDATLEDKPVIAPIDSPVQYTIYRIGCLLEEIFMGTVSQLSQNKVAHPEEMAIEMFKHAYNNTILSIQIHPQQNRIGFQQQPISSNNSNSKEV